MTRVAMVLHRQEPLARELAATASNWLQSHGHTGWILDGSPDPESVSENATRHMIDDADLVLSLGGDGTMLRAVRLLADREIPLLGINLGQLGYLTEVERHDMIDAIERFTRGPDAGGWTLDSRMMLDVSCLDAQGELVGSWSLLNEVSVERSEPGESIRLLLHIDGAPFTTYATDGLIVSTPTGSTAYSLSARGPVISPRHRAMLVTPVAPHQLFDRSLVLDPSESVVIELGGHRSAIVVIDGSPVASLVEGATITCRPSNRTARFVRFGHRPYHQILKAKFRLTDR